MSVYTTRKEKFTEEKIRLNQLYNRVALARLLSFLLVLGSGYYYLVEQHVLYLIIAFSGLIIFLALLKWHQKIVFRREFNNALLQLNEEELCFLNEEDISFDDGREFGDPHHPYVHDLDIFGPGSLFQHLNRTATYIGKMKLAQMLMSHFSHETILRNQQAVEELSGELDWRHDLSAMGRVNKDSEEVYRDLIDWCKIPGDLPGRIQTFLAYFFPVLLTVCLIGWLGFGSDRFYSIGIYVFIFNLMLVGTQLKKIRKEMDVSDGIEKILHQYGWMLQHIREKGFSSEKLRALQERLTKQGEAGERIKELSRIYNGLNSAANLVGAFIFNGCVCYHLHVLRRLYRWKTEQAVHVEGWLEVIAELEALGSLANFKYNNTDFVFPALNDQKRIDFRELGHPLINSKIRVGNDVTFGEKKFIILTGSNMSGKSTFLRSLGVNMVLGGIGAPVCAREADIHPLHVFVSMRVSDSLSENESYFYAEVKRLKEIMDHIGRGDAFVLLDEILRGTNSDDKRSGTMQVIRKMVGKGAIGAIATHDLEVCKVTEEYPDYLVNKCFEVEIINDDLHFDYRLRDGICKNKNATFLMKKMEII